MKTLPLTATSRQVIKAGVLLIAGMAALALCGAPGAHAGVALNTIDEHVTLKQNGAQVRSTGPIGCTRRERIAITVSVGQAATGARAHASGRRRRTGDVQHWRVRARARTAARFARGPATVCAVARTRAGQRLTETPKWCRPV